MDRRTVIALISGALLATACGGGGGAAGGASTPSGGGDRSTTAATPALAKAPKRAGEILVGGEASPASHGSFSFDGKYTVRFEQIAPEDPSLDFASQTAFVADLDRKAQQEGGGTIRLFRDAARTGRNVITAKGRYYVDVSFGDFPYAVRFTPEPAG
jgi:hypothetical protein